MKSLYDYENEISELLDDACNQLSPEQFEKLKDAVDEILADYE